MTPEIKYTQSGEVFIAYEISGGGPIDIVLAPGFISHLEHQWEEPRSARFFHALGSIGRLIRFDKRGTGLSDRSVDFPTMDERIDDIRAVMEAAGSSRAMLIGMSEGGAMSELFAATYPEKVSGLILMGTYAEARSAVPEYADIAEQEKRILTTWGTGASLPSFAPNLARDPAFVSWWARFERLSASPSAVIKLRRMNAEIDVRPILPSIRVPTLVIHHTEDVRVRVEAARHLAANIPGARLMELPGKDHFVWLDETGRVVSAVRDLVGVAATDLEAERMLATVLFTDIVDSTRHAVALGDAQWRSVLDAHNSLSRNEIRRFRGREVKTLGDGILATFDGPARAVRCAQAIAANVRGLGITIRAGLHTGEIEVVDERDVGGIAVSIAARVSQLADGDEVLVSRTVKDLVAGSGLSFADLGSRSIKGLDDLIQIYRLAA